MADPTTIRVELPTGTVALAGSTVIGGGVGVGAPGAAVPGAPGTAGVAEAAGAGEGDAEGVGDAGICAAAGAAKHAVSSVSAATKEIVSLRSNFAGAEDGRC